MSESPSAGNLPYHRELHRTLRRVQQGDLSARQATDWLLANQTSQASESITSSDDDFVVAVSQDSGEPIQALLDRLGTPPVDIIDRWCQQLCLAALVHQQELGQPLPVVDCNQWMINASGELLWNGYAFRQSTDQVWIEPDHVSLERISEFRDGLLGLPGEECARPITTANITLNKLGSDNEPDVTHPVRPKKRAGSGSLGRYVFAGLLALAVVAIGLVLSNANKQNKTTDLAKRELTTATDAFPGAFDFASTYDPVSNDQTPRSVTTDAVGSVDDSSLAYADERTSLELDPGMNDNLSLDSLIPSGAIAPVVPDEISIDSSPSITQDDANSVSIPANDELSIPMSSDKEVNPLSDDDSPSPDESPQPIRRSEITSVALPNTDDVKTEIVLFDAQSKSPALEFPIDLGLELVAGETAENTQVRETRSRKTIAEVLSDDRGTRFRWKPAAKRIALSASMLHGRIKDGRGNSTFLRPNIETDTWRIDLTEPDLRPTWDLFGPIPPRKTRLSVEFELPDELEEGWIEPIEPSELRRARGVAVLTPKDGENVALGLRFDVRCSRQLSIRIRYAARLDSQTPWQMVSRPGLTRWANQVTQRQTVLSNQIMQMDRLYSGATYKGKQELRPRRDAFKEHANQLTRIADRLADLQQLVALVESHAKLKLKVWVEWPETQQILMQTISTPEND